MNPRAVFVLRDGINLAHEYVEVTIIQPEGPACGHKFVSKITIVSFALVFKEDTAIYSAGFLFNSVHIVWAAEIV